MNQRHCPHQATIQRHGPRQTTNPVTL